MSSSRVRCGDGDVLLPAEGARRHPGLEEPPDPREATPPEDDRPLLAVHVVHQHDDRGAGHPGGPEGHAVLGVDDHVEPALGALERDEPAQGGGVDAHPAALAQHPDPVAQLLRRGVAVGRAQQRHVVAGPPKTFTDCLGILLGAPAFGMCRVSPVQEGNAHVCSFIDDRRRMLPQDLARGRAVVDRPSLRDRSTSSGPSGSSRPTPTASTVRWPPTRSGCCAGGRAWTGRRCSTSGEAPATSPTPSPRAGARYAGLEPDAGELTARGGVTGDMVRGSGLELPVADHSVDVAFSSNVLEHVPDPRADGRGDAARHPARRRRLPLVDPVAVAVGRARDLAVALPRRPPRGRPLRPAARPPAQERPRPVAVHVPGRADGPLGPRGASGRGGPRCSTSSRATTRGGRSGSCACRGCARS